MNILDEIEDNNNVKTVKLLNEKGSKQMIKYLSIGVFCHILNAYEKVSNVNVINFNLEDMKNFSNFTFSHLGNVRFGEIINDYGISNNERCYIFIENEKTIYNIGEINLNTGLYRDEKLYFKDTSSNQTIGIKSIKNLCKREVKEIFDDYITTEIEKTFNELYGERMPFSEDIYKNLTTEEDLKNIEQLVTNIESKNEKDFKKKVFEYYNDKYYNKLQEYKQNDFKEVITKFMGDNVYDDIINEKLKDSVLSYIEFNRKLPTKIENIIEEQANNNYKKWILQHINQSGDYAVAILEDANNKIKDDKEFILKILKRSGKALEFVSDKLKNDKEVVLEAIKQNRTALKYASKDLKKLVNEKGIDSLQQATNKWNNANTKKDLER